MAENISTLDPGAPKTRRNQLEKLKWWSVYTILSQLWSDSDWRFMNFGYIPTGPAARFALDADDERDRVFIGLYFQAVSGLDLKNKKVLEVGSGRGGGAAYIAKYFSPESFIGMDYSPGMVRLAKRLHRASNLSFKRGDAKKLPFPDNHFDLVVNIESSHCYPNIGAFVSEVARVLKPGGCFSWADTRGHSNLLRIDNDLFHPHLTLTDQAYLNDGVIEALDLINERKMERIRRFPFFRKYLLEFSAAHGSTQYGWLKSGVVQYLSRRYRKKPV